MSFSSGTFTLASGNPVTTLTTISSTWCNTTLSDIATGLSTCVLKDGTQTMTANLPMAGFKLTGMGAGSTTGDSIRYEQLFTTGTVSLLGSLFVTNTLSTTGALNTPKAAAITATATISIGTMTGNYAVVTGTNTITSFDATAAGVLRVLEFSGAAPITHNATSMILPNATSIVTQAGQCAIVVSENSGNWRWLTLNPSKQPTSQVFTSGTGTYTTPAGATRLRVRQIGGGGGGAGGGSAPGAGTAGNNTTFNTVVANGGSASNGQTGAAGGTGGTGTATIRIPGGYGGGSGGTQNGASGYGGNGVFGGGGPAVGNNVVTQPANAAVNSGGGGSGGGNANAGANPSGGGGAGEYAETFISAPAATYTYTVGATAAGGTAGGTGGTGGTGAAGIIIVEEWYD